jgi:hypothetical protein
MTKQDTLPQYSISQTALVSIIGQVISGYPNPDDPEQFGPWWVIIRRALQQVLWRSGPQLDPWIQVELNPQPLPPRTLFFTAIAQEVVERAALIQETADALQSQVERQGIIIIGGYISRFADDFELCPPIPWPFRWPRPYWLPEQASGEDLIVTGVQFGRAASQISDGQLRQSFAEAGAQLTQAGLAKLQ